jgi:hypothetical protein
MGGNVPDINMAHALVLLDEMVQNVDMLGTTMELWVVHEADGALVIRRAVWVELVDKLNFEAIFSSK